MSELFKGFGIQIELPAKEGLNEKDRYKDAFHVVKETLTRIGVASEKSKTLYQSCHILHKRGEYGILHFKELFAFDGKSTDFSDEDRNRRNIIVALLRDWKLLIPKEDIGTVGEATSLKIIPFSEKKNWTLLQKYSIGTKKKS